MKIKIFLNRNKTATQFLYIVSQIEQIFDTNQKQTATTNEINNKYLKQAKKIQRKKSKMKKKVHIQNNIVVKNLATAIFYLNVLREQQK